MRTTVDIPDEVFREAKIAAARRGVSLKELLRQALERELGRYARKEETGEVIAAAMAASPWREIEIEPERIPMPVRPVEH